MDELVKSIDALSREQLALLVARVGLGAARVPVLLPGAAVSSLPLAPSVSEEDRKVRPQGVLPHVLQRGHWTAALLEVACPAARLPAPPLTSSCCSLPQVVENLAKLVEFLGKGGAAGAAGGGTSSGGAAARARADVAAELLPYLPAVAQEVLPELGGQLLSRISARFVREVFIAPRGSSMAAR